MCRSDSGASRALSDRMFLPLCSWICLSFLMLLTNTSSRQPDTSAASWFLSENSSWQRLRLLLTEPTP